MLRYLFQPPVHSFPISVLPRDENTFIDISFTAVGEVSPARLSEITIFLRYAEMYIPPRRRDKFRFTRLLPSSPIAISRGRSIASRIASRFKPQDAEKDFLVRFSRAASQGPSRLHVKHGICNYSAVIRE